MQDSIKETTVLIHEIYDPRPQSQKYFKFEGFRILCQEYRIESIPWLVHQHNTTVTV